MRTGILPLGRGTFDVAYANEKLAAMLAALESAEIQLVGPQELLTDAGPTESAIQEMKSAGIDRLVILQVTFTDAAMTVAAAAALDVPLGIWAVPEPRLGGRLRLNAFCGLNLASHALGLNGREFAWLYRDPAELGDGDLAAFLQGKPASGRLGGSASAAADPSPEGKRIAEVVSGKRIARIGEHPVGFDTCAYSSNEIKKLAGVDVDALELRQLFDTAKNVEAASVAEVWKEAERVLDELETVNQEELDRSLRLKVALEKIKTSGKYDAFAIRCWPETFTEYGGAVCGPVSMMGEARTPCACEADVYGALTQIILQETAQAAVFLTDLVDMDVDDDTGVVWHCGQAPVSMCKENTKPEATIHTNRKMPLLYQFGLKPGTVTFMRISQAFGETRMVLGNGEMLDRPMAFTGTSGVVRFEGGTERVLRDLIASGLEHHMALAYGDHRPLLREVATAMNIPILELGQ